MSKRICPECGYPITDATLKNCPECGFVLEVQKEEQEEVSATSASEQPQQAEETVIRVVFPTTDTGTSSENTIKNYGDFLWGTNLFFGIMGIIVCFALIESTHGQSLLGIFVIIILLLWVYVIRAFIRVIHNISINLHEINMKLR